MSGCFSPAAWKTSMISPSGARRVMPNQLAVNLFQPMGELPCLGPTCFDE